MGPLWIQWATCVAVSVRMCGPEGLVFSIEATLAEVLAKSAVLAVSE